MQISPFFVAAAIAVGVTFVVLEKSWTETLLRFLCTSFGLPKLPHAPKIKIFDNDIGPSALG